MQITIGNETFDYTMNGTIGPAFVVEQMTGEPFNPWGKKDMRDGQMVETEPAKPMHSILLFLVILQLSNPEQKDMITLDFLLGNMTTPVLQQLTKYTVDRWMELEGWKDAEGKKVEDTPKND